MRPTRTTVLLTAGLVTLFGAPAAAAAEAPTSLYVNNGTGSNCSDAGSGTQAVPYCTISAAAKVVQPGQTVRIRTGKVYDESVTLDRSGEPGKPISFVPELVGGAFTDLSGGKLTISGASHVLVQRLITRGGVQVTGSSDIELDRIYSRPGPVNPLVIGGGSTDVRLSRSTVSGILVNGGARGTVLSNNNLSSASASAVAVVDAPGTVITNNTVKGSCAAVVSVSGGSTGSGLFNNVLITEDRNASCTSTDPRNAVLVAQSASAGTLADYNLIAGNPNIAPVPYSWSGTTYKDLPAFRAATGQGAHDILLPSATEVGLWDGSPGVDSADATAPGVLTSDLRGKPVVDNPLVPNTGKNGGHLDRGSTELQDGLTHASIGIDQPWAPVGTEVQVQASSDSRWPTAMNYQIDFGDGTPPVAGQPATGNALLAKHAYGKPGEYTVKVTATNTAGVKVATTQTTKVTPDGPGTVSFTDTPVLPTADDPSAPVRPLTVDFDASSSVTPWPVSHMDVDFGDTSWERFPGKTTARHAFARPGDHKVTVTLFDTKGGKATTTRTVRVDYAPSGYVAAAVPLRLEDTRVSGRTLQGGQSRLFTMPGITFQGPEGQGSGGMASAVVNVTLTNVTQDAFLSVSPQQNDNPTTSNLNARAGGTVSNTVTVPVDERGFVWLRLNAGQADVIVDFVGHYQPNSGQKFSPIAPSRLVDTRTEGVAVAGGTTRRVHVAGVAGIPADVKAVAVNLTSTDATSNSFVVAYPDPANRPAVSNLNPEPGKAKSNQAIVPVNPNGTITLYNHSGSAHLIVDAVGFYGQGGKALFTPVVPQRLGDTRVTGKLGAGATATVAGVPAGAVGAVVNLTATESTGAGYLTAYGFGATRPDASSLNTLPGLTIPNHVTTPVADGKISVFNGPWGGSTHVITDLLGYFSQG
ncbi:PKD domain-containing protein [Streptomyces sp. NBC_01351]|uniref:PKD domain-containing protein n=1 Tax=Streptomyces sp. NBC_01351 TaxID=2903833 RepID=UPI002E32DC87|nr:PKD domain-containing protein [Streptomyces sp. NBC_01351]